VAQNTKDATMIITYELKLADGTLVCWDGTSGEDASRRYADCHPSASVVAWRYPTPELFIGILPMWR
jgi:hypothetical protein